MIAIDACSNDMDRKVLDHEAFRARIPNHGFVLSGKQQLERELQSVPCIVPREEPLRVLLPLRSCTPVQSAP